MPMEATKKLFTVDEYYKLAEVGVLSEGVRTELIDGEILEMSAMGAFHAAAVARSLRYDRDVKLPIYAVAGVAGVWIEDLPNRILHVYREPEARGYKTALQFRNDESVSPLAFPEISYAVSALIGPL